MKNNKFTVMPKVSRIKKLRTVIRRQTNNALSNRELDNLVECTVDDCQYWIRISSDPNQFCCQLMAANTFRMVIGELVIGERAQLKLSKSDIPAAAVSNCVSIKKGAAKNRGTIHIYVPSEYEKEHSYVKQRSEMQNCV